MSTVEVLNGVAVACPACGQENRIPYSRIGEAAVCERCGVAFPLPSAPIEIEDADQFEALIGSSALPVLVDFWAPWCNPCRVMAPELERVAIAESGSILVAKVNVEQAPSLADRYEIMGIPTLALFVAGELVDRTTGLLPASDIQAFAREGITATLTCSLEASEVISGR